MYSMEVHILAADESQGPCNLNDNECGHELVSGHWVKKKKIEVSPVRVMKACMGTRDVALLILNLALYRHE